MINNNYTQIKELIKELNRIEINRLIRELSSDEVKSTILSLYKAVEENRDRVCPYCNSKMTKKIGKPNGNKRYLCHRCHKSYFATNKSVFYNAHKDKDT
jgi:transposase-like protein